MNIGVEDAVDAWRLTNVVLGTVSFVWLTLRISISWESPDHGDRAEHLIMMLFVFAVTYGAGEAFLAHAPPGNRIYVTTIAVLTLLIYLAVRTVSDVRRGHPSG